MRLGVACEKKMALANLPHSAEIAREIGSLTHISHTMHIHAQKSVFADMGSGEHAHPARQT